MTTRVKDPRREIDRPLEGDLLAVHLTSLVEGLKAEALWDASDRNSRTLFKAKGLQVVLVAMRSGARLKEHRAQGPLTIQVVEGRLRIKAKGEELALEPGGLVQLGARVTHEVEASTECAFLLTIGAAPAKDAARR